MVYACKVTHEESYQEQHNIINNAKRYIDDLLTLINNHFDAAIEDIIIFSRTSSEKDDSVPQHCHI